MSVLRTRLYLFKWGRWASGGLRGFPQMSAFMRLTERATSDGQDDPDLLHCDKLVATAPGPERRLLIRHYCGNGTATEKAQKMKVKRWEYFQMVDVAVWGIHVRWDDVCFSDINRDMNAGIVASVSLKAAR